MSLANNVRKKKPQPRRSKIQRVYDRLSSQDQADLVALLADPEVSQRAIAAGLADLGHTISTTTINDARRQGWEPAK